MDPTFVHRELLLPPPSEKPPEIAPLNWGWFAPFSFEVHRETSGRVRYAIGTDSETSLEALITRLESSRPRLRAGPQVPCAAACALPGAVLARAIPSLKHHHLPLDLRSEHDPAGLLIRTLESAPLRDHDAAIQVLFRTVRVWESGLFSPGYDAVANRHTRELRAVMDSRRAEAAYHVELRTRIYGPRAGEALEALEHWLEHWTTYRGMPWRWWKVIPEKSRAEFESAVATHDITRFASRRARRDVSATELAHLIGVPWAIRHPECS